MALFIFVLLTRGDSIHILGTRSLSDEVIGNRFSHLIFFFTVSLMSRSFEFWILVSNLVLNSSLSFFMGYAFHILIAKSLPTMIVIEILSYFFLLETLQFWLLHVSLGNILIWFCLKYEIDYEVNNFPFIYTV